MSKQKEYRAFERAVAKQLGGRAVPASGAGQFKKGDVETNHFLLDCKYTDATQRTLKIDELHTIESWAKDQNKHAGMIIGFGWNQRYAIIPIEFLQELEEHYNAIGC